MLSLFVVSTVDTEYTEDSDEKKNWKQMTHSSDAVKIEGANHSVLPYDNGATLTLPLPLSLPWKRFGRTADGNVDDEETKMTRRPFMDSLKIQFVLRCEEKILKRKHCRWIRSQEWLELLQVLVRTSFVTLEMMTFCFSKMPDC